MAEAEKKPTRRKPSKAAVKKAVKAINQRVGQNAAVNTEHRTHQPGGTVDAVVNPKPIPIPQIAGLTVEVDGEDGE